MWSEATPLTQEGRCKDCPQETYIPRRLVLLGLVFVGTIIDKFIRVSLSMAIIPISEETGWDKSQEGLVLSSFFWGFVTIKSVLTVSYAGTQIFGGALTARFGAKLVAGVSLAGGCPFVLLFPFTISSIPLAMATQVRKSPWI